MSPQTTLEACGCTFSTTADDFTVPGIILSYKLRHFKLQNILYCNISLLSTTLKKIVSLSKEKVLRTIIYTSLTRLNCYKNKRSVRFGGYKS